MKSSIHISSLFRLLLPIRKNTHSKSLSWERKQRVCVARFDGLGDWILTIPLVTSLYDAGHQVTLFVPPQFSSLFSNDQVTVITENISTVHSARGSKHIRVFLQLIAISPINQLRVMWLGTKYRKKFDFVVLPRRSTDLGFNMRLWALGTEAGVVGHDPTYVRGLSKKEQKESKFLTTKAVSMGETEHELVHLMKLGESLGQKIDLGRDGFAKSYFSISDNQSSNSIGIHINAARPKREWPSEYWRKLVSELLATDPTLTINIFGTPSEAHTHKILFEEFRDSIRYVSDGTALRDLPQELANCRIFIGTDSGISHLAASVGTPTLTISPHPLDGNQTHPNSPTRFSPWVNGGKVLQPAHSISPCTDACEAEEPHCITQISVEQVVSESISLLEKY